MIVQGNSFRLAMADNSVHVVASSFPYWGLRDYGLKPLVFGGRDDCQHEWISTIQSVKNHNGLGSSTLTSGASLEKRQEWHDGKSGEIESAFCIHCQAWRGSFGLEPTMDLHIKHAIMVCREIKRVLRPDGIFWLNYGDSYATGKNGRSAADGKALGNDDRTFRDKPFSTANEVRAKNLCMIPQKVAIALQADGWIIRSAPPWVKRNPMPESVQDRPGTGHEYVFMLVKNDRYFWDMEGVRKTAQDRPFAGKEAKTKRPNNTEWHDNRYAPGASGYGHNPAGRALRTSDFFFDSLDSYIAHLQDIRDNGGLMLEADGSPAAFVVNPKGYSVTSKNDKEIGRYAHSYDTIDTVSPDCPIHAHLLNSQMSAIPEYDEQLSQNRNRTIDTDGYHVQECASSLSAKMTPAPSGIYSDQGDHLPQSISQTQKPENIDGCKNEADHPEHTSDAEIQNRTNHTLESGDGQDYKTDSVLSDSSLSAIDRNTQNHKTAHALVTSPQDSVSAQMTFHTGDTPESHEISGHTSHIRENNTLEVSALDGQEINASEQTTYHSEDKLKFPYGHCTCKLKKVKTDHYATWPIELVTPMIRAATSDKGVCPKCGKQWVRVVEKVNGEINGGIKSKELAKTGMSTNGTGKSTLSISGSSAGWKERGSEVTTTGWRPSCSCDAGDPIPAIVLDPFCGSGATGEAAHELGRRFIGVDLNPSYLALNALPRSEKKTSQAALETLPMFAA